MDKAAVSRAKSHGVDLEVKYEGRFPSGPNGERLPSYFVATGCHVTGDEAQREKALDVLEKLQQPPEVRQIEEWLAELSVLTAGRSRSGVEAGLLLNAYSSRLAKFPTDVVKYALLTKTWRWFPTWDELEKECRSKASPRRQMIAALKQPPETVREYRKPTEEERQRIQEMVNKRFPKIKNDWKNRAVDLVASSYVYEERRK